MNGRAIGGIRRAQVITTYGVGSLIAVESNSYMVTGIHRWPDDEETHVIYEPRLQRQLRVSGFRLPPSSENERRGDIPVQRFPNMHYCPESNVLADFRKWGQHIGSVRCKVHDRELVPSRFVVCCPNGHIDEFPYFRWVHAGAQRKDGKHELSIKVSGVSAALRDIVVACTCGESSSMEGALGRSALKHIAQCQGRRPWLGDVQNESCEQVSRGMQRGASGVWFSVVRSAISIPPWSEGIHKLLEKHWKTLGKTRHVRDTVEDMELTKGKPFTFEDVVEAVEQRRRIEAGIQDESATDLKAEEYEALTRPAPETSRDQDFVCIPDDNPPTDTVLALSQVMRVKRLREVRVLESFTRLQPPSAADDARRRASLHRDDDRPDWLPAIEVIGEGVFLGMDQARLTQWENLPQVQARVDPIDQAYAERFLRSGTKPDRTVTPRLVLMHTLSHAIMNEWSLDSGYPVASLRERLYVSNTMAGILIYTATSDSAGSLGGIVAQVESGGLSASIGRALNRISWCSADPLCIESTVSGVDNLNRAACHACVLLPETCCEEHNTLLDRGVLAGIPDDRSLGFFADAADPIVD